MTLVICTRIWAITDSARSYFEQALSVYEHALGEQHPWVATAANNLGSVLQDLGDLAGAKAAYARALAIDEAAFGHRSPKVAMRINNLGNVLHALGDDVEAQSAFERALAIDEQTFGPDHPDVARDLNNLGSVLRARDDLAGAKAAYERALHIGEAAFGPEHPNVAIYLSNLGNLLQDMGDLAGARAANQRAGHRRSDFRPEHPMSPSGSTTWAGCCRNWAISPGQRLPSSGRWQSLRNTCRRSTPIFRLCARTWRRSGRSKQWGVVSGKCKGIRFQFTVSSFQSFVFRVIAKKKKISEIFWQTNSCIRA